MDGQLIWTDWQTVQTDRWIKLFNRLANHSNTTDKLFPKLSFENALTMFTHYFSHSYCKNSCVSLLVGKTTFTCSQVHSWWILLLSKNQFEQNNSLECAFYTDRFENGEFKYLLVWGWLYGSHVDTKNRSVSPTTGNLALFYVNSAIQKSLSRFVN